MSKEELPECPVATTVGLIENKWKPLILRNLLKGPQRFKYLQFGIEGIIPKVLTENLKQLEDDGIIKRQVFAEVALRVEYSLTEFGEKNALLWTRLQTLVMSANNLSEKIKTNGLNRLLIYKTLI